MPLDAEMQRILDTIGHDHAADLKNRPVPDALALIRSSVPARPAGLAARYEDRALLLETGKVSVRICWPDGEPPYPILLNFHGGGWVTGSVSGDDLRCQRLTVAARCITISVEYRLAPEHPFPAGLNDCWAVTRWVFDHADEIGGDPSRIAVSGASAGANLAAAVALAGRDLAIGLPVFQLLYYPVLDATTRGDIEGGPYYLSRDAMDWYWDRYLGDFAYRRDQRVSPLLAKNLTNVAPALIVTAELDPLAAEGRAYSTALADAGVKAKYVEMAGMIHGFISYGPQLPQTLEAVALGAAALRQAFGQ